jgi:hypothetical protein
MLNGEKRFMDFFKEVKDKIQYLFDRWQDEKEYEDFKDYDKPLLPIADKHGVSVKKMTKCPFEIWVDSEGTTFIIRVTSSQLSVAVMPEPKRN